MGSMIFLIPLCYSQTLPVEVNYFNIDVRLLVRLHIMGSNHWMLSTLSGTIGAPYYICKIAFADKFGLIFVQCSLKSILLTLNRNELERLHLHVLHSGVYKLICLFKYANTSGITSDTKRTIGEISDT